ncbi:MAG TPA: hypothetical protein PKA55_02140 [Rhodoblastus sp.]|nr:hypothetical protein [Rhodoblastus sp.]
MAARISIVSSFVFAGAIVSAGAASATDLTGTWSANGYTCGAAHAVELVAISDDGRAFVGTKLRGDACVTTGAVTFFGTWSGAKICKLITGSTSAPNSGTTDCGGAPVIKSANQFTLGGITFTRTRASTGTSSINITAVDCKNVTTNKTIAGTIVGSGGWACDRLGTASGDQVSVQLTGTAE